MSGLEVPQPCPLCGTITEPELDNDHLYYECESENCVGYAWGYVRTDNPDPDCAIGVPLAVRKAASQFDPPVERSTGVNLGTTIGLRPGL